jgi:hypothetical protein
VQSNDLLILALIGVTVYFLANRKKSATTTTGDQPLSVTNISNAEVWKWTDIEGNNREITITRDVHINGNS